MSAATKPIATAQPETLERDSPYVLPHLTLAPAPARKGRPRIAYAAVVILGVFSIVCAQLLLSIALSDGAYQIASLQTHNKELARTAESLTEQAEKLASPQNLAMSAEALGMVSNANPVYLRLSDGAVIGNPAPASAAAGVVVGGQSLVPNAALNPVAPQIPATPTAPTTEAAPPTVAWQGELPAPTTR